MGRMGQYKADKLTRLTSSSVSPKTLASSVRPCPLCVGDGTLASSHSHTSLSSWEGQHQESFRKRVMVYCVLGGYSCSCLSLRLRNWPMIGNHTETHQMPQNNRKQEADVASQSLYYDFHCVHPLEHQLLLK